MYGPDSGRAVEFPIRLTPKLTFTKQDLQFNRRIPLESVTIRLTTYRI